MNLDMESGAEAPQSPAMRDSRAFMRGLEPREALGVRRFTAALGSCSLSSSKRTRWLSMEDLRFHSMFARPRAVLLCLLLCGFGLGPVGAGTNAPPSAEAIDRAIDRGIRFLLKSQNPNGSWGSARRTKNLNIFAPVPGAHEAFRSGVTGLAVQAMIESGAAERDATAGAAIRRGEAWLLENLPGLRRADAVAIYNVWGHAYGIQALAAMHGTEPSDARRQEILDVIRGQIDLLRRYESVDGGWGYYDFRVGAQRPAIDSTSFVTAAVLVAFREAKRIGVEIPQVLVDRGVASLKRQQKPDFSYLYSEDLKWRPMRAINRPAGSLGRSQACNLALRLWGDTNVTDAVLDTWLERFNDRIGWLSIGRKRPVPHESWFQVAGYFYYYGHFYAALCADELAPDAARRHHAQLAAILLPLQEKDGSWWDYPLYDYHRPYGTGYALMSLARSRAALR